MATDETWRRLAERVRARREERRPRLTQTALAREAGTSDRTIGSIERAEQTTYHPATLRAVSVALGWTPDSIERILRGEDPVEASTNGTTGEGTLREAVERLEAEVEKLKAWRAAQTERENDPQPR